MQFKKMFILLSLTMILAFGAYGCSGETEHPNATMVATQEADEGDPTGLVDAETSITWTDGVVSEVMLSLNYISEEYAQTAYNLVIAEGTAEEDVTIDGANLTYPLDALQFAGVTYESMLTSFRQDGEWTVVEE